MPIKDLREFIETLEKNGELKRVSKKVSPKYELAAICRKLIASDGPAVLFEKVEGSSIPVVSNILANRAKIALALECKEEELVKTWLKRTEKRIEPEFVKSAPCQEVIEKEVDLMSFPVPIFWNAQDGGPYITFGLFICKNPETGVRNIGLYRIHIKGKNRIGINIRAPQHAGTCHLIAERMGKPLECAVVIGADPACYLASQAPLDFGDDEFVLAGSLNQEPSSLVKCKTVDLEVPASAEIVLEGKVLPQVREPEGPFGEWTGYVCGQAEKPVVEFHCLTRRRDPLFCVTYEGYPTAGTSTATHAVAREPVWFRRIQAYTCPTIKDLHFTAGSVGALHAIVSIKKLAEGQAKNVIMDLLRGHTVKHVVVVDEDIDARDLKMVEWAIATRVQADKDVIIIPESAGMKLDPSQPHFPTGLGAKMGIDATRPLGRAFPEEVRVPEEIMKQVEEQWDSYGL